jgi:hypothetical protein
MLSSRSLVFQFDNLNLTHCVYVINGVVMRIIVHKINLIKDFLR